MLDTEVVCKKREGEISFQPWNKALENAWLHDVIMRLLRDWGQSPQQVAYGHGGVQMHCLPICKMRKDPN